MIFIMLCSLHVGCWDFDFSLLGDFQFISNVASTELEDLKVQYTC